MGKWQAFEPSLDCAFDQQRKIAIPISVKFWRDELYRY